MTRTALPKGDRVEHASGALRRCLADAETAARTGDAARARHLLQLALDLADPGSIPMVLLTAHTVREWLRTGEGDLLGGDPPGPERAAPAPVPGPVLVLEQPQGNVGPLGYPTPKFASTPPPVERLTPDAFLYGTIAKEPPPRGRETHLLARTGHPMARKSAVRSSRRGHVTLWMLLMLGAGGVAWYGAHLLDDPAERAALDARAALDRGDAPAALARLERLAEPSRTQPGILLLQAEARLLHGDTTRATTVFLRAAEADVAGNGVAWRAAEQLAGLPEREQQAADAFLLAFSAGLAPERWESVARAQTAAGRTEQAARIRKMLRDAGGR